MFTTVLLCAVPVGLVAWILNDLRQYAAFKREASSAGRVGFYLRWSWQGFVMLSGASLLLLAAQGRLADVLGLPPEFADFAPPVDATAPSPDDGDTYVGFVIGATLGVAALVAVQLLQLRRTKALIVGDVEPLIPRNRTEMLASLPLCLNAGFSEELFFRLALPLLVTTVTGSAIAGLVSAGIAFGLVHAYQGYKGVLATTALGALLTWMYLSSGSLLRPMLLHAAIDVVALIVRPSLARWLSRGASV
ncbi:MAG: CPBP family intramembrane metalloprotease [Nannocystaceae bacterium]|nr:CPBP family intramembrane metalloprotease [Nannocystaceae bacterium]